MTIPDIPFAVPLIGGLLIGFTAMLMLLLLGRLTGISGIIWGAVSAQPDNAWRWTFLVGLVAGTWLFHTLTAIPFPEPVSMEWWYAAIAGALVGFGTQLSSGCTSGHGVCGIGRRSPRGLAATVTFMATGVLTVYVIRHVIGGL